MKIKIIFAFLSVIFFAVSMLFVSIDERGVGAVLGDTIATVPVLNQVDPIVAPTTTTVTTDIGTVPLLASSLQAVVSGATSVRLGWTQPGNAVPPVSYKVFRNGVAVRSLTDSLSYEDTGLASGSGYSYFVLVKDSLGRSTQTSSVKVSLPTVVIPSTVVPDPVPADPVSTVLEPTTVVSDSSVIGTVSDPISFSEPVSSSPIIPTNNPSKVRPSGGGGTVATPPSKVAVSGGVTGTVTPVQPVRTPVVPGDTLSERDTDGDGLPDSEEVRIGSNPFRGDTDSDGFQDAEEVKKGFNPLKSASSGRGDKIVFESPKEKRISKSAIEDRRLRVEKVERVAREDGKVATKISGKGTPNSFLTVYVYSDPIVVTVKTDADGNWSYELDRDLEDGKHEVYVAVTDATGRISAQSSPIPFVKTAQAISVASAADLDREIQGNRSPVERVGWQFVLMSIALIIIFLLVAFYFIGHRALSNR